jgi:hypothetical protein
MGRKVLIVLAVPFLAISAIAILYVLGIRSRAQWCKMQPIASTIRWAIEFRCDQRGRRTRSHR